MEPNEQNLVWLDLEMSGLDVGRHRILEIATLVTDANLNILAEGPVHAIYQSEHVLLSMDEWCQKHHQASGLVDRVRMSKVSESQAEKDTLHFLTKYVNAGVSPLCGNSVHQDRIFLNTYMPELARFFHYRNLDVSSFKIAANLWQPELTQQVIKRDTHLALVDIVESVKEMRLYKEHLFKNR